VQPPSRSEQTQRGTREYDLGASEIQEMVNKNATL